MRYYYLKICSLFVVLLMLLTTNNVKADLPLSGKVIVIDPGHGAEDPGTVYKNIFEKDIDLNISLLLEKELVKNGASVILTRDGDYDLSTPNSNHRKKSDFDNRIRLINNSNANMYLSIHLNYLEDSSYKGPQIFYNDNSKNIAKIVQSTLNDLLNGNRNIKKIPISTYMYNKINIKGVLIECGFLSNKEERSLLITKEYQQRIAEAICIAIINYYH